MITNPRTMRNASRSNTSYSIPKYTYKYKGAAALEQLEEKTHIIVLTAEQEYEMNKSLKIAILKQMHNNGLLTDVQLGTIINDIDK